MTLSHDRSRVLGAIAVFTASLLATLATAGTAQAVSPPTVLLGTAAQYAVLAGSGMTNTGVSTINGDVGSTPTRDETGFTPCPAADCVSLVGTNHNDPNPNDAVTQGAKVALATAYDDAAGRSPIEIVTELAGQTLVAGVYDSASGTFGLTGPPALVLDGENNADAVFIFQTDTTLITGAGAAAGRITLIRGAQACNIFWKVGSSATLGGGTQFKGTVLAHTSISVGNSVTVEGRLLAGRAGAGAVTMDTDTITRPSTCASQSAIDAATAQAAAATAATQAAATAAAAATEAARAAAAAKAASDEAAAAKLAAEKAAEAANVEAARVAAATAAEAARVAAASAEAAAAAAATAARAAREAAARAARAATARAAAAKAAAAARAAAAQARAARVAAAKAKTAAKVARAKVAAAKKRKLAGSSSFARPARRNVGLTG